MRLVEKYEETAERYYNSHSIPRATYWAVKALLQQLKDPEKEGEVEV